jgi:hypothetical protein
MKFYRDRDENKKFCYYYLDKVESNKLTAICIDFVNIIRFLKNGRRYNDRNSAYIEPNRFKIFYLNGKIYGDFTKESWRRFVKLQVFL